MDLDDVRELIRSYMHECIMLHEEAIELTNELKAARVELQTAKQRAQGRCPEVERRCRCRSD